MPDLRLEGCAPEPLMSYLKALGILRLVAESEEGDREAKGAWVAGAFVLQSRIADVEALAHFFLEEYEPTPIVAPWAGGSGFFGKDNREAVEAIASSTTGRLRAYREVIQEVRAILLQEGQHEKPSDEAKVRLLRRYRRELPDAFVAWMDCALVLQGDGQAFPPVLGTGGNDGRLDFTQNFMQRLVETGLVRGVSAERSPHWLRQALAGEAVGGLMSVAVGQFDPGRSGGPNASQGLEGGSLVNPWDFILMIEGAIVLAGSATRRLGAGRRDRAGFPFTVGRSSPVGFGSAADAEGSSSRGELWLPLWSNFATLAELRSIFAEGRAEVADRPARNGVDFARAVAGLGVDRGIARFVRYGFLRRSGKSYVATPLGSFDVPSGRSEVELLRDLDTSNWLDGFRRACQADDAPPRFAAACRRIDSAIFDYCRYGDTPRMVEVLCALGNAERELATGERFRKTDQRTIYPVPPLSAAWLDACDDGTAEYRLARSLAFIRGDRAVGDFRINMEPVESVRGRWLWAERVRGVVWSGADLTRNLLAIMVRRQMEAGRVEGERLPSGSFFPIPLADVAGFLVGQTDDFRLEELLWGMVLIKGADGPRGGLGIPTHSLDSPVPVPRVYALLKLLFLPHGLAWPVDAAAVTVRPEPEILGRLRAGDPGGACRIATRRLRASGFVPMPGRTAGITRDRGGVYAGDVDGPRLAAALLFPVAETTSLAELVLRPQAEGSASLD
jgi:CRISPR-associated protein Csx17